MIKPHFQDEAVTLYHGDCLDILRDLPSDSIESVCTDPPYDLTGRKGGTAGFMGKTWDGTGVAFRVETWAECLRVLKPGGHLLAFGGSRTWHRLAVAVEDAGFEVRDSIAWLYGSGFPKSLDVGKAIDKAREDRSDWLVVGAFLKAGRETAGHTRQSLAPLLEGHKNVDSAAANVSNWENGLSFPTWERWVSLKVLLNLPDDFDAEVWRLNVRKGTPGEAWSQREVTGKGSSGIGAAFGDGQWAQGKAQTFDLTAPATDAARQWHGWGTALKPAFEPIVVARKPLVGTVAANVQQHGTGALNISACRVAGPKPDTTRGASVKASSMAGPLGGQGRITDDGAGRWPTNVVLDGSQADALDAATGIIPPSSRTARGEYRRTKDVYSDMPPKGVGESWGFTDSGGASRFFPTFRYQAKAPTQERPKAVHPVLRLRDDITDEQRAHVLAELTKRGVDVS